MWAQLISLDEVSQRLEKRGILGRLFAEILVKSEPLLLGVRPGYGLHDPIDLSHVASLQVESGNVVVADGVRWTNVKLAWLELCAAFQKRGRRVPSLYISPEAVARSRELGPTGRSLRDPRRSVPSMRAASAGPQPVRRARPEWFEGAVLTAAIPASGKLPRGKRGPRSGKRENAAAAILKDLEDKALRIAAVKAMPEKELAARYGVSRDTARKARHDALSR